MSTLEAQLKEAFTGIAASGVPPYARERELVSLFVFGYLLPTLYGSAPLHSSAQIGIEVAVPQRQDRPNPRKNPDVCKDLVLWPEPGMVCWDSRGMPTLFPMAIIEWKTVNRKDPRAVARAKRDRAHPDLEWLRWYVAAAPTAEGYAVTVDLSTRQAGWRVQRVTASAEEPAWFVAGTA